MTKVTIHGDKFYQGLHPTQCSLDHHLAAQLIAAIERIKTPVCLSLSNPM